MEQDLVNARESLKPFCKAGFSFFFLQIDDGYTCFISHKSINIQQLTTPDLYSCIVNAQNRARQFVMSTV